jgi:hypothetical protein
MFLLMLLGFVLSGILWIVIGLPWYILPLIFLPVLLLLLRGYPGPERLAKPASAPLLELTEPVHNLPSLTREYLIWAYLVPALLAALLLLLLPIIALLLTHQILSLALFVTALPLLHQLRRVTRYLRFLLQPAHLNR